MRYLLSRSSRYRQCSFSPYLRPPEVLGAAAEARNNHFRVSDPAVATSAVDMAGWWQGLPEPVTTLIYDVKRKWPLSVSEWQLRLQSDPDWQFLARVLSDGVSLVHPGSVPAGAVWGNYKSYLQNVDACNAVFQSELDRGLVTAAPAWFEAQWVHPLGAVPKKNGKVRVIHDCSAAGGRSLNDHQWFWYLPWASIDTILQSVTPGCYLAGIDIQEYYRNFGVNPVCWPLQCFANDSGTVYIDSSRLQFGHRLAPEVAMRSSSALCRFLSAKYPAAFVSVMDDFTIVKDSYEVCLHSWEGACADLRALKLQLSEGPGKTEPPSTSKVSLGLCIDSVAMAVSLCPVKLSKLVSVCQEVLRAKRVSRKQLERLLGFLLWASRVIYAGRTFCHNILSAMLRLKKAHHHLRVSGWLRSELQWWLEVAPSLNGAQKILPAMPVRWSDFQVDASLTGAGGLPCVGIWVQGAYVSLSMQQLQDPSGSCSYEDVPPAASHISVWELYAVVVAVRLFGDYMAGKYWRVRSDNAQVVAWFMKGDAPPHKVSAWLKEIASVSVQKHFRLGAKHIPGAANCMADALSRCAWADVKRHLLKWQESRSEVWQS